jgi:hypothetical protein
MIIDMRSFSGWTLLALLLAGVAAVAFFSTSRAGSGTMLFLPVVQKEEAVDLSVPQVVRTIVLPESLCLNAVGYNRVTDTWYVADHHKVHNGLYYDKHNGRVNVLRNHELVAHLAVGGLPTAFASDPQSGFTYLTNIYEPSPPGRAPEAWRACGNPSGSGWDPPCISVFDGENLLKQYDAQYKPFDIVIHPHTRRFYASDVESWFYTGFGTNSFSTHRLEFRPEPGYGYWSLSMAIDPGSGLVYVATWGEPWLYVIDGESVIAAHELNGWGAREITLDHRRGLLYIANSEAHVPNRPKNNITVIDLDSMQQTSLYTAERSFAVGVHYDSGLAYVVNRLDGTVSVLRNGEFSHNVAVGNTPRDLDINQRTGYVYVLLEDDDQVAVLREGTLVTKLPTGRKPFAVLTDSWSGYTYIANRNSEVRHDALNRPFVVCMPNPEVTVVR